MENLKTLKYVDVKVVFQEIPDEVTLAINISGCPIRCPDCHSQYLWEDTGVPLNVHSLHDLLLANEGISCVCFMGGDSDPSIINELATYAKEEFGLKTAWYSGRDKIPDDFDLTNFNYIKEGPYIKERGGLDNKETNQRLYKIIDIGENFVELLDITNKFWKHEN